MTEEIIVINPATQKKPDVCKRTAVKQSKRKLILRKFQDFKKMNAQDRSNLLLKWAEKIEENRQEIAELIAAEGGKPLTEAR